GFQNDPVLGLVENLGLHGTVLSVAKVYVGVLAATILFIATNAGVIGASRITYAMSSYRQLPEVFRRLHPRFKTPWLSLVFFAGFLSILTLLPGKVDFLSNMYAFGAMLSFTIAHASLIALRLKSKPEEAPFRARPNLQIGGRDRESEEAVDLACRLAADRGSTITAITVLEIPMELPLSADIPEQLEDAYDLLDEAKAIGDSYGVNVQTRLIRARSFGRAIVD